MKRPHLARYSVVTVLLVFALARCSPLAQSVPKVGGHRNAEEGTGLSLPTRSDLAHTSTPELQSAASTVSLRTSWVESGYRESELVAQMSSVTFELSATQLDEWVDAREVVAFQLPAGETLQQADVVFRLDLSAQQMNRAEIPQIQVVLVPSSERANHWVLRITTAKETAVRESFNRLERITIRLPVNAHPSAPSPLEPVEAESL